MYSDQSSLPFARTHHCSCQECRCDVMVHRKHHVCRACRNGGHDLRSMLRMRVAAAAASAANEAASVPHIAA